MTYYKGQEVISNVSFERDGEDRPRRAWSPFDLMTEREIDTCLAGGALRQDLPTSGDAMALEVEGEQ